MAKIMKCKYCQNLDEMEREYPDAVHHGASLYCDECEAEYYEEYEDECEAEYYEEYEGEIVALNKIAQNNHPELKKL